MTFTTFSAALWLVTIMAQAAALFYSLRRFKPELASFLAWKLAKSLTLNLVMSDPIAYYYVYVIGAHVNAVFTVILVRGIFRQLFAPYSVLPKSLTSHVIAVSIVLSIVMTTLVYSPTTPFVVAFEAMFAGITASALMVFVAYRKTLGIQRSTSIMFGFSLYTFAAIIASRFPVPYLDRLAWLAMLLIWLSYLVRPARPPLALSTQDLHTINQLREVVHERKPPHAVRHQSRGAAQLRSVASAG